MQPVRGGERVVHGVPVAVVVLHVEAHDAERGRVGDRPADLLLVGSGAQRVEQGGRDHLGIVVEELPAERADVGELARGAIAALGERAGERVDRAAGERGVVVRMAPLAELFRARGGGGLAHQCRQDLAGGVLAEVFDRLERLVGEVDRVAAVDEHVVGHGREHHRPRRRPAGPARRARSRACARRRPTSGCRRSGGTSRRGDRPVRLASRARRPRSAARDCACRARRTSARARARAPGRRASSWGSRLAIATSTVRPAPQPELR